MTTSRRLLEFAAGAGIGVLVGLIAGLSISPVTSTILGALSTGLLILLGLKSTNGSDQAESHALRVSGFGLCCSLALVGGVILRTHDSLSPSIQKQRQVLIEGNTFDANQINQVLLLKNFGLQPLPVQTATNAPTEPKATPEKQNKSDNLSGSSVSHPLQSGATLQGAPQIATASLASAGVLRAGSATFCQVARRSQYKNVNAYLDELRRFDSNLPAVIASVPEGYRDQLSQSLSDYLCP